MYWHKSFDFRILTFNWHRGGVVLPVDRGVVRRRPFLESTDVTLEDEGKGVKKKIVKEEKENKNASVLN